MCHFGLGRVYHRGQAIGDYGKLLEETALHSPSFPVPGRLFVLKAHICSAQEGAILLLNARGLFYDRLRDGASSLSYCKTPLALA